MTGAEPLWMLAAKSLSGLVIKTGWDMANKDISKPIKQRIFNFSKRYISNYWNRHGLVQVLGMSKPVSLESMYTAVQILDAETIRPYESIENLEETFRESNQRNLSNKQGRKSGIEVANTEQYLTVLGQPGVGKSTFLSKTGLEALKGRHGQFEHFCMPVFLELKRFDSDAIDIKQLIVEEFGICGLPNPGDFTDKILGQGRLLILFDGLDEVPSKNLTQVIRKIQDFKDRYRKNRFITSCRTAAYRSYFKGCTDVSIAEFTNEQIEQFIHNWFQSELDQQSGTAKHFWKLLRKSENLSTLELAQTPLLLTFLCLVYNRSQKLPDNRSDLYRKALDILLEEWAAEKRIQRDEIYQGLHTSLEKALLSEVAHEKFENNQLFFSRQEILQSITSFLTATLDVPKKLVDGKAVLNAIEVQQGILVERAENIYSFSHLTIQEFLVARHVANNQELLDELIAQHLIDDRWREVFLLVAGLQDSADKLLLAMENHARTYIRGVNLQYLILQIEQIADNMKTCYKSSAKRALLIGTTFDRHRTFYQIHEIDYLYHKTFYGDYRDPRDRKLDSGSDSERELVRDRDLYRDNYRYRYRYHDQVHERDS